MTLLMFAAVLVRMITHMPPMQRWPLLVAWVSSIIIPES